MPVFGNSYFFTPVIPFYRSAMAPGRPRAPRYCAVIRVPRHPDQMRRIAVHVAPMLPFLRPFQTVTFVFPLPLIRFPLSYAGPRTFPVPRAPQGWSVRTTAALASLTIRVMLDVGIVSGDTSTFQRSLMTCLL